MNPKKLDPPIRTLIVDDEFRSRSSLRILLSHHFPHVEVVGESETVAAAITAAASLQPDLVFLDIELPDGSAFDFLEVHTGAPFKVVIVSAHPEHSVRAFKYATLHYLLKPLDLGDLKEAIHRATAPANPLPARTALGGEERIALPSLEGFKVVALSDIVYCEADSNYTVFHFGDKSAFTVSNTLGYYEELLADKPFYRVHNKFLVHFQHIQAYHRGRGGWVEMSNGKSVEVSARKKDGFLEHLTAFTRGM